MKRVSSAIAVLLLIVVSADAHASVLATSTRQTFTTPVGSSPTLLPLDDAGATSVTFSTASTQTVLITYSTDCQVNTLGTSLAVVIYVDGIAAAGTGASSAGSQLCGSDVISAASRTAFITVGAGSHTVQITGQIIGGGTGRLRRTVTAVQN